MSETQITYPVWNSHHDLSWLVQRNIVGIPRFLSQVIVDWLGSPFLLFRLRDEMVAILKDLPANIASHPLIEIDICVSQKAAALLEEVTHEKLYKIGQWLTNQFSSLRFQEIIGRQIPNVVVHLWQNDGSVVLLEDFKILPSWTRHSVIMNKLILKPILANTSYQNNSNELVISHSHNAITTFGIEELATLLKTSFTKTTKQFPFLAKYHIEIASTNSWNGSERLWIRHHAYHETWKISENVQRWDSIPRDAWTPVLSGNTLILGRALPMPGLQGIFSEKQMICLPGSLLIRVLSHE